MFYNLSNYKSKKKRDSIKLLFVQQDTVEQKNDSFNQWNCFWFDSIHSLNLCGSTIVEQVMKNYREGSDLVEEIQKTLSLNKKATDATALNKLQSLMRKVIRPLWQEVSDAKT